MSSNYRQTIFNHILINWEKFQPYIEIQQFYSLTYFQQMIIVNEYASSEEIEVAALLPERQFNVKPECNKRNDQTTSSSLTSFQPSIRSNNQVLNLLLKNQHFQYLTPTLSTADKCNTYVIKLVFCH